jgi:hypothetical protein
VSHVGALARCSRRGFGQESHGANHSYAVLLGPSGPPFSALIQRTRLWLRQPSKGSSVPRLSAPGGRRLHRLVQRHLAAQRARLPDTE